MTNWKSPEAIERQAVIFNNIIHFFSGFYTWEIAVNLHFDWSIVSGSRRFRWPMILYFACRYLMFFALIGVLIVINVTSGINCQALYTFNQFAGNSAIGTASTLFMLRTIAVWNRSPYVTVPLVSISLGHWGCLLHGMTTVVSVWDPVSKTCEVVDIGTTFLDLIYFYTMSFDFVVLVLTSIGLYFSPGRSSLWRLIFRDGIIFFLAAFVSNSLPAIAIAINLNPIMNIMFSVPAACIASSVACRSFIRVSTHTSEQYIHTSGPSVIRAGWRKTGRKSRSHTISEFVYRNRESLVTDIAHMHTDMSTGRDHIPLATIPSPGSKDVSQETINTAIQQDQLEAKNNNLLPE